MDRDALAERTCQACGACCTLHVSFPRREVEDHGGTVPAALVVPWGAPGHVALRQHVDPSRCAALEGEVGRATACGIYPRRPSPCRAFEPSWLHGEANPWCDEARARHGLPGLLRDHWSRNSG